MEPPFSLRAAIIRSIRAGSMKGLSPRWKKARSDRAIAGRAALIDADMPSSWRSLRKNVTGRPPSPLSTLSASNPVTTAISPAAASTKRRTVLLTTASPFTLTHSLLKPSRFDAPAARITVHILSVTSGLPCSTTGFRMKRTFPLPLVPLPILHMSAAPAVCGCFRPCTGASEEKRQIAFSRRKGGWRSFSLNLTRLCRRCPRPAETPLFRSAISASRAMPWTSAPCSMLSNRPAYNPGIPGRAFEDRYSLRVSLYHFLDRHLSIDEGAPHLLSPP